MHPIRRTFWQKHSLSIVTAIVLVFLITAYIFSNEQSHLGAFYGNAIADWSGLLVTVLATKFFVEQGSSESRKPSPEKGPVSRWHHLLHTHSLMIFLVLTGALWLITYIRMDNNSKWGQVVGNIVSEWTQILGLIVLTKRLVEVHSKE